MRQLLALAWIVAVPLVAQETPSPANLTVLAEKLQAAITSKDWKHAVELSAALKSETDSLRNRSLVKGNSALVAGILNWLPLDTETVAVSSLTLALPIAVAGDPPTDSALSSAGYILSLLSSLQDGTVANQLAGQTISLAVLGARHFRTHEPSPSGALPLGMTAFQGCGFYSFTRVVPATAFAALPSTTIAGQPTWTAFGKNYEPPSDASPASQAGDPHFLTMLKPDLLMVCNDRNFYTSVVSRLATRGQGRALPDSLPEWKQLDRSAPFWALRHYHAKRMTEDPSLSLLGEVPAGAIGLTYQIGSPKDWFRLTFLGDSQQDLFEMTGQDPQFAGFTSRQIAPDIWQLSANAKEKTGMMFSFLAMGMMGFVVFL